MAMLSLSVSLFMSVFLFPLFHAHVNIKEEELESRFGFFWHLTDFDLDPAYSTTGNVFEECHKNPDGVMDTSKLPGTYGDFKCDVPQPLLSTAMVALLEKGGNSPDFLLWTGNARRTGSDGSPATVFQGISKAYNEIRNVLKDTPGYPCLGQNDFYPKGRHTYAVNNKTDFYEELSHLFRFWIEDEVALKQFAEGGFYAVTHKVYEKLRIIVLNTNLYVEDHIASAQTDPGGQWMWLETELTKARSQKQFVYIVVSVPPGIYEKVYSVPGRHWFKPSHNRRYIRLVRRFGDVIKGQFGGNNHVDTFRVFYSKKERPVGFMMLAPSLSPRNSALAPAHYAYSNPGIRLYMFNTRTMDLIDYTQYYLNLTLSNIKEKALWETAYSFTTFYSVPNVSIFSLQLTITRLQEDLRFFQRYFEASTVMLEEADSCDLVCNRYHMCAFSNVDYNSFFECVSAMDAASPVKMWGRHYVAGAGRREADAALFVFLACLLLLIKGSS